MSHKTLLLERLLTTDETSHREGKHEMSSFPLDIKIHPTSSGVIIINYPGYNGDIDGFNNKYGSQADFIQEKNIGSVIRLGNYHFEGFKFRETSKNNLKYIIDYAIDNANEICNSDDPSIYLMGFSAGASTISATAHEYSQVKKILLMAPSGDAGIDQITEGLEKFNGEVYISLGEHDEMVGPQSGQTFYDLATNASLRKLVMIPNCNHQFRGEVNGKIMSKAPLWAFANDETYPSPEGGIKLY